MKRTRLLATVGLALLAAASFAQVRLDLTTTINGDTPTGGSPFATALFENAGANTVRLTMSNTMPTSNFINDWVFNVNTTSPLSFNWQSGNKASVKYDPNDITGGSSMKGGLFDILFDFPTSGSDPNRFNGGESSVYLISGSGLTASSFLATSLANKYSPGGYLSAARVQGFGGSGSVAAVPEPGTMSALALAAGAAWLRRRRKKA